MRRLLLGRLQVRQPVVLNHRPVVRRQSVPRAGFYAACGDEREGRSACTHYRDHPAVVQPPLLHSL